MSYEGKVTAPALPGMIFSLGSRACRPTCFAGRTAASSSSATTSTRSRKGKQLDDAPLGLRRGEARRPAAEHRARRAIGNNGFGSNLPASFQRDQRLSLEGDFDRYFIAVLPRRATSATPSTCSRPTSWRASSTTPPSSMSRSSTTGCSSTRSAEVSTLDPATWAWLFGAVGALMTKFDQWARWRDDRLLLENPAGATASAAPTAAPRGRDRTSALRPAGGAPRAATRGRSRGASTQAQLPVGADRVPDRLRGLLVLVQVVLTERARGECGGGC